MLNKILIMIPISCLSLFILNACGSGGGSSSGNSSSTTSTLSATVLLPGESDGSIPPGSFTLNSCTNMTESSICAIKLTWTNLPSTNSFGINGLIIPIVPHSGQKYSDSSALCTNEVINNTNGSCIINYDFVSLPSNFTYESTLTFKIMMANEKSVTYINASPINFYVSK
ncbi:MAG: hypothetical protein ACK5Z5_00045 [Neisseriaceae bacterium]